MSSSLLQGRWQMVRAELSGEAAPELVTQRTVLEIAAGSYSVSFDGRIVDAGACELTDCPDVRTFVLRGARGTNAGRIIRCIYQLVGERLRICYGMDATTPTAFVTTPGDARYLATYRRIP